MSKNLLILFPSLIALSTMAAVPSRAQVDAYRIIGYYAAWGIYEQAFYVTDIAADKLTHINYAFALISEAGEVIPGDEWADTQFPYPTDADDQPLKGNFNQLRVLKEKHPGLQTLISVGGWTGSARFSDAALTDESRERFARSAVDFVTRYGFDGVDLDWEFPTGGGLAGNVERPEDPENFGLLLQTVRAQLDAQGERDGKHYPLTIALASARRAYQPLDWARITPLLDWINVMTYDMNGWNGVTDFNAPLYPAAPEAVGQNAIDPVMTDLLALNIPAEKLVLGVPFYGYGWQGVGSDNDGLYQPFESRVPGGGTYRYNQIVALDAALYPRHWDDQAASPWRYNAQENIMIAYDDVESMNAKAAYVREHHLGGMMIWELSLDTREADLLTAVYAGLK